jgi:hypothetical protein
MKRIAALILAFCLAVSLTAQTPKNVEYVFTEASTLTLTGKLFPDTPNPYHRADTVRYKGFNKPENQLLREPSGIAVAFHTNSSTITVKTEYLAINNYSLNTGSFSLRGYDLYIKKDGKWLWAAAGCPPVNRENGYNTVIVKDMDGTMKECLLYLPLRSELKSVQIGVESGSVIEKSENPFRHRIAIFGSSYTHGISTSRPGMTYPAQFCRATGLGLLSLGVSGNSKLQPQFAQLLAAADAEAFVFDGFSNPTAAVMRERLFPFIETVRAAHPGKPLIFLRSIYREKRNFDTTVAKSEAEKWATADSLMRIAVKRYPDVYYIDSTNATDSQHDSSVDGVHPGDHGYTLWMESIRRPLLRILRKYGIK